MSFYYKMILFQFFLFYSLTCMFFFLNFLAATQDIAVDGWALTMLKRENVGYASTCNSVGQTAGYFMGYVCTHTHVFTNFWFSTEGPWMQLGKNSH